MNKFICPECGGTKVASTLCVSTDWSVTGEATSPWSYVLQQLCCYSCNNYIPAHLGERWNNITYKKAVDDWKKIYKNK